MKYLIVNIDSKLRHMYDDYVWRKAAKASQQMFPCVRNFLYWVQSHQPACYLKFLLFLSWCTAFLFYTQVSMPEISSHLEKILVMQAT